MIHVVEEQQHVLIGIVRRLQGFTKHRLHTLLGRPVPHRAMNAGSNDKGLDLDSCGVREPRTKRPDERRLARTGWPAQQNAFGWRQHISANQIWMEEMKRDLRNQ